VLPHFLTFPTLRSSDLGFSFNRSGDTGAYVEIPDHPIFHFGSSDFSIGFWTNLDQIKNTMFIHQLKGDAEIRRPKNGILGDRERSEEHTSELQSQDHIV